VGSNPRKRLLIDAKVQGTLILRIVLYWFFCVIVVGLILIFLDIANGPVGPVFNQFRLESLWVQYGAVVIASVMLLPILVVDTVLNSNRFAGPLFRVRRSMKALAAGETVQPIHVRKKDLWADVAEEFNAVLAYVEFLKRRAENLPARPYRSPEEENDLEPQVPQWQLAGEQTSENN